MRSALIVTIVLTVVASVSYVMPTVIELEMLRFHLSPWICILFGDLMGCYLLASLDFGKTAAAVYVTATAIEGRLLMLKRVPLKSVMWMADILPTLILASVVFSALRIVFLVTRTQPETAEATPEYP